MYVRVGGVCVVEGVRLPDSMVWALDAIPNYEADRYAELQWEYMRTALYIAVTQNLSPRELQVMSRSSRCIYAFIDVISKAAKVFKYDVQILKLHDANDLYTTLTSSSDPKYHPTCP